MINIYSIASFITVLI